VRDADRVRLLTRNGHDWSDRYPWIVESARDHYVQFYAFDVLALNGDDLRRLPLSMRKASPLGEEQGLRRSQQAGIASKAVGQKCPVKRSSVHHVSHDCHSPHNESDGQPYEQAAGGCDYTRSFD
jgi:hypothetical protein